MTAVYLSGKYSGDVERNIAVARGVAIELWEKHFAVFCPHLNTANMEIDCRADYQDYIDGDLEILSRFDAIIMLPGWRESKGARIEKEYAQRLGIPVYYYPTLPMMPTLTRR